MTQDSVCIKKLTFGRNWSLHVNVNDRLDLVGLRGERYSARYVTRQEILFSTIMSVLHSHVGTQTT